MTQETAADTESWKFSSGMLGTQPNYPSMRIPRVTSHRVLPRAIVVLVAKIICPGKSLRLPWLVTLGTPVGKPHH